MAALSTVDDDEVTAPGDRRPPGAVASPGERAALGKAARKRVARSEHADWAPASKRRSPVEILAAQDAARVPELVPVRYGRMLDSPFTFYRGAAAIMAADLGAGTHSGLDVQLCGDAHLSNFGVFGAPDRTLVFDINDFDETLPGPFEWDVKRLAASFAVGARQRGFNKAERRAAVNAAVGEYRLAMRQFAGMRELDIWYARLDVAGIYARFRASIKPRDAKAFDKLVAKATRKDSLRGLARLTERVNGELRIASRPPVLIPIEQLAGDQRSTDEIAEFTRKVLSDYRQTLGDDSRRLIDRYRYVHGGRKVVGVGSVGTRAWIALLVGRDDHDPLFLQIKEAQASVLEPYAGTSRFRHHGHRVVAGQRLTQAAGDILLGWLSAEGLEGESHDFYVRQLWDGKGSAEVELMGPERMAIYGTLCGWTLARAHARSGDAIAIAAYLGNGDAFDRAIGEFSDAYADQNERDFRVLTDAVDSGGVEVELGV
jgi:uncharacterized protein (DUF2252 family)